jgi:hypothetical protein
MFDQLLVYDIEIANAIPEKGVPREADITYCNGWRDFAGMGIACIGTCHSEKGFHCYTDEDMEGFDQLASRPGTMTVGFNSKNFDEKILHACRRLLIEPNRSFDLLRAIWNAVGLNPDSFGAHHHGYGLADMCASNGVTLKQTLDGQPPVLWQRGRREDVKRYCMGDVVSTMELLKKALLGNLRNPKNGLKMNVDVWMLGGLTL